MMDAAPQTVLVAELKPCGLQAGDVSVHFDDTLQEYVVTVKQRTKVDASNFICLRRAVWAKATLEFEDPKLGKLYSAYDDDVSKAEGQAMARAWLAQRGLPDKLPTIAPGETASNVIDKIERFCGVAPGAALEDRGSGFLTYKAGFLGLPPKPGSECLLYTMMAIDLEGAGFSFGFVGNAYSDPTEKK